MAKYISNIWTTTLYLFTNGEDNTVVCFQMDSVQLYTTHCKDIQFAGNSEGCKRYLWLFICPYIWKDRNNRKEDISSTLRKKLVQWKVQRFGSKISWKVM